MIPDNESGTSEKDRARRADERRPEGNHGRAPVAAGADGKTIAVVDEKEMEAQWMAYQQEGYEQYLERNSDKKPHLLTQNQISQIAGQFQSMEQLFVDGYEPTGWLVKRLVPTESIITLQGQAKSGLSTFVLHMVKALTTGGEFLGQKLDPAKVVYVTEQNRKSFMSQLDSAAIDQTVADLTVLTVERTLGFNSWKDLFRACEVELLRTGAKLLVIDSWGRFTGITEEEENKAAPVQERITQLRKLVSNTGATVLMLHHVRKSGGNMVNAGMSSSALAQQVDVILSMSGQPAQEDVSHDKVNGPDCRLIQSKGRFPDMINGEQIKWEREQHRYVLAGGAARAESLADKLFDLLPKDP
jgi:RecA-family ATPase